MPQIGPVRRERVSEAEATRGVIALNDARVAMDVTRQLKRPEALLGFPAFSCTALALQMVEVGGVEPPSEGD